MVRLEYMASMPLDTQNIKILFLFLPGFSFFTIYFFPATFVQNLVFYMLWENSHIQDFLRQC